MAGFALPLPPSYNLEMLRHLAILCLVVAACGPAPQSSRARTGVDAYRQALESSDPRPLYKMLTREQRKQISYEQWVKLWQESKDERRLQAEQIANGLRVQETIEEKARVRFDDGRQMTMTRSTAHWGLNQALLGRHRASTAADAISIWAQALSLRDAEGMLDILSIRRREAIEKRLEELTKSLEVELANPDRNLYEPSPERAVLSWYHQGVHYKLTVVRENGDWRIDDIHLGPDPSEQEEAEDNTGVPNLLRRH